MVPSNPGLGANGHSFEEHAREVILRFQAAVGKLVEVLPIELKAGPTQTARAIGMDTKLAWKITHLLEHSDPFDAGRYIPGMAAVKRFLQAAARHDPPGELVQAVHEACDEFEAMVKLHAKNRRAFDMLLAGQAGGERHRAELEHRKAAYHSNSFLWGLQAQTQLKTAILAPSADPDRYDGVSISGFIGLRRIRAHVPWRITSTYSVDDDGTVRTNLDREALDPDAISPGSKPTAPLLARFCSSPLPTLRPMVCDDGAVDFALAQGDIGRMASETCILGERLYGVEPRFRAAGIEYNAVFFRMRTPCEVALLDVFVHRDLFPLARYEPRLFSDLFSGQTLTGILETDELSMSEVVEHRGAGVKVARTPAVPQYQEMLRFAFERAGWDPERFDLRRIQMRYPITPTNLVLRYRMPERPA
jgi:hypothetical protein